MAAVLHDSTPETAAEDFSELMKNLRDRAAELKLDAENMAVWCSSANVRVGFPYAMDPSRTFLKALVVYYGVTDPALMRTDLPVMLARAGLDMPYTNQSMAAWAAKALQLNAPVTMANLPNGRHGFDVTDDHEASRDVVRQTLAFLRANLSSDVQKGRADRGSQARAISLRGAGRHAEAEEAFRQWLAQEPGSGIAQQGLGDSLYQLKRYPEAARSYEKAGDAGVMPSVTWYNAACAYALSGDTEKALELLAKAVGTGFIQDRESIRKDADFASMKDDPRFERILSGRNP
jgi:tetratricopeptide (TPR) repeat protein